MQNPNHVIDLNPYIPEALYETLEILKNVTANILLLLMCYHSV